VAKAAPATKVRVGPIPATMLASRIAPPLTRLKAPKAVPRGALEMGVDLFLTKPCLPEELKLHLRRLVAQRQSGS
jgi:CheY-like chemotaxis protein